MPSSAARRSTRSTSSGKDSASRSWPGSRRASSRTPLLIASKAVAVRWTSAPSDGAAGRVPAGARAAQARRSTAAEARASCRSWLRGRPVVTARAPACLRSERPRSQESLTPRSRRQARSAVAAIRESRSASYAAGASTVEVRRRSWSISTSTAVLPTVSGASIRTSAASAVTSSQTCWRSCPRSSARTVDAARASSGVATVSRAAYQGWVSAVRVKAPSSA